MSQIIGGGGGSGDSSLSGIGSGGNNGSGQTGETSEVILQSLTDAVKSLQNREQLLFSKNQVHEKQRKIDKKKIEVLEERLKNFRAEIDQALVENSKTLSNKIDSAVSDFSKDKLEPIKDQINQERIKVIEVIGIFVSIFTFVSAEITIMRGTCVVYWSGFTLILLGGLSFFVLMMRFMFKDLGSSGVNFANENLVVESKRFIDGVWYNLKSVGSRIGYSTIILFVCSIFLVLGGLAQTRSAMYNEAYVCKNITDPSYSLILNGGETNVRVTR